MSKGKLGWLSHQWITRGLGVIWDWKMKWNVLGSHLYLNRLPISASQISFFFDGALYTDLLYLDYYK